MGRPAGWAEENDAMAMSGKSSQAGVRYRRPPTRVRNLPAVTATRQVFATAGRPAGWTQFSIPGGCSTNFVESNTDVEEKAIQRRRTAAQQCLNPRPPFPPDRATRALGARAPTVFSWAVPPHDCGNERARGSGTEGFHPGHPFCAHAQTG